MCTSPPPSAAEMIFAVPEGMREVQVAEINLDIIDILI
jgi:hypothetical protein